MLYFIAWLILVCGERRLFLEDNLRQVMSDCPYLT